MLTINVPQKNVAPSSSSLTTSDQYGKAQPYPKPFDPTEPTPKPDTPKPKPTPRPDCPQTECGPKTFLNNGEKYTNPGNTSQY